jgi:hypothetical protein
MRNAMVMAIGTVCLAACGPNLEQSCQDYIDANVACIQEAYADDQASADTFAAALDGYCDAYAGAKGDAAKAAADMFDCYAEKADAADCSTAEGYTAYSTSLGECAGG